MRNWVFERAAFYVKLDKIAKVLLIKFSDGLEAHPTRKKDFCGMGILPVPATFAILSIIFFPAPIVILIYESSPEKNRAINEIIETYKQRFYQESVLRATSEEPSLFLMRSSNPRIYDIICGNQGHTFKDM